jgi:hypothetical protein
VGDRILAPRWNPENRSGSLTPFPDSLPAARILSEIRAAGRPSLGPGPRREGVFRRALRDLSDEGLLGTREIPDRDAAASIRAGLLLFSGDLDGAHRISQELETPDGSYWHALVHRREPDYSNARYWFRRVGSHPVPGELLQAFRGRKGAAAEISSSGLWDPCRMVDLVEAALKGRRGELVDDLEEIQEREMLLLLAHSYRRIAGKP